jgi:hypothetical protein
MIVHILVVHIDTYTIYIYDTICINATSGNIYTVCTGGVFWADDGKRHWAILCGNMSVVLVETDVLEALGIGSCD